MVRDLDGAPKYGAQFLLRHMSGLWQNARLLDGVVLAWLLLSRGKVIPTTEI